MQLERAYETTHLRLKWSRDVCSTSQEHLVFHQHLLTYSLSLSFCALYLQPTKTKHVNTTNYHLARLQKQL